MIVEIVFAVNNKAIHRAPSLLIHTILLQIGIHGIGYQVAYGFAQAEAVADEGGGEIEHGSIEEADGGVLVEGGVFAAAAAVHVDGVIPQNELVVFPLVKGGEVVAPHDKGELVLGVFLAKIGKCIDGIRGLREPKLDVGRPQQ